MHDAPDVGRLLFLRSEAQATVPAGALRERASCPLPVLSGSQRGGGMNENTLIRMWTIFGTDDGNEEICDRHIAVHDIPAELAWQSHRCHLNGNIKVVKLTI